MKKSELSFLGTDVFDKQNSVPTSEKKKFKAFDWCKAAEIIKNHLAEHPDLVAEAGLQGDWNYTGGVIFEEGKPTNEHYTYLSSNWATPTIILEWDDEEQLEVDCWIEDKYSSDSKWDDESLTILGIQMKD